MLGNTLRKLDYRLAIAGLAVILVGTVLAGIFGGLRVAGLVGFLLFIFLDGLSCAWTVLTFSTAEKAHEKLDATEKARFDKDTKDNPTLR